MTNACAFPYVDPGAVLRLDGDQWSLGLDSTRGTHIDVVVYRVRADVTAPEDEWLWVLGHRPECGYPAVDQHPPCIEIRLRSAALHGKAGLR
ncbi:hypothetical protein [Micromonospora chalcea]|uniref:hypothetical protein n=1 Tax=Micromonospora chalcea TaxID=1874 RepID=UPI001656EDAE|nr:hypothetical protein [Micromonospora chalcea]MBC8991538.1 hypothetical protein [Micromonospora chalcea]